jgi:7,8-dihydropterin-6-yl-methyl-4-(beta-D-ribofuranosyl)aminobenzene 5'-phosphate synthase
MNLKILYDNDADPGFTEGWGFSCLITLDDEKILFDTGWDGDALLSNMGKMGENPGDIRRIVLSHPHWDHIGGVNHIRVEGCEVWVPRSFSKNMKAEMESRFEVHEVGGPQAIRDGVWTTGELGDRIKEQSLVLGTSRGLLVIVGCSHPGVSNIISSASNFGSPWGIIGGMHGTEDYEVMENLGLIVPTHCTVHKKEILARFPETSMRGKVGLKLEIDR